MDTRWLAGAALLLALCACRDDATLSPATTVGAGGANSSTGASPGGNGGMGGIADPTIRVMTWNIEQFPKSNMTVSRVAALIDELQPDVLAVQEISEPAAFDALVAALPDYGGVLNQDPGAFIHVGLLYRTQRVVINDAETLFSNDWYAFPRPPLKVHIRVDDGAFDFVAVVVHLKATLDAESEARRRDANEKLDTYIAAQQQSGNEQDFVLLGDFNDKLTDPAQYNVYTTFLDKPRDYTFLTMPAAQADAFSYITFEAMIDHILITNDALDEYGDSGFTNVLTLEQTIADYEDVLSDHRPVMAEFRGTP